MNFLPVGLRIAGKRILVVGGGRVGLQKVDRLLPFTRRIAVLAREFLPEFSSRPVRRLRRAYSADALDGRSIVYAATNDRALNRRIRRDARARGILVNVVDDPALCDFISPAIHKTGRFTVAVSSDATDTPAAVRWRDRLAEGLASPPGVRREKLRRRRT